MEWTQIIQNVGIMGTLVLLLIWIQWKRDTARDDVAAKRESRVAAENLSREQKLSDRISVLESFTREELLGLLKDSQVIMTDNTRALSALTVALSTKPCLLNTAEATNQISKLMDHAVSEYQKRRENRS